MNRILFCKAALLVAAITANVAKAGDYPTDYYAPPVEYGAWKQIGPSFDNKITFRIRYEALGSTQVVGQVMFTNAAGQDEVRDIVPGLPYEAGRPYAAFHNVYVRFRGIPLGSGVNVVLSDG
jgi:hypothetical protein